MYRRRHGGRTARFWYGTLSVAGAAWMLYCFARLLSPVSNGIAYQSEQMLGMMRVALPTAGLCYAGLILTAFDAGLRKRCISVILPILGFSAAASVGLTAARLDSGLAAFCGWFISGSAEWFAVQLGSAWLLAGVTTVLLARAARGPFEMRNPSNQLCILFGVAALIALPICGAAGLLLLYVPYLAAALAYCQMSARAAYRMYGGVEESER